MEQDIIEFNSKAVIKRKKAIVADLNDIESEPVLTSDIFAKKKSEKKAKKESKKAKKEKESSVGEDEWAHTLESFKISKPRKSKKNVFNPFEVKKKKKKKKDGEPISHKGDFEDEMALLRNLQIEQSKFVDSIQKKYDQMEGTKSTARGVGKYTTDLIMSINTARDLSMKILDKIIATKKSIADLDMKEREKFGKKANSEAQNRIEYSNSFLKSNFDMGRNNIVNYQLKESYSGPDDSEEDLFNEIDDNIGDESSDSVPEHIRAEKEGITFQVLWHDSKNTTDEYEQYDFIAVDKHGNYRDDFTLPQKTKMFLNRQTGVATDGLGRKYDAIID